MMRRFRPRRLSRLFTETGEESFPLLRSHGKSLPGFQIPVSGAKSSDLDGHVVICLCGKRLLQIEDSLCDDIQTKGPVECHQCVDEQLASLRPLRYVVIAELTVDRGENGSRDDARMVRHGVKDGERRLPIA